MKVYKRYFDVIFMLVAAVALTSSCSTAPTTTTAVNSNSNAAVVVNSNAANSTAANTSANTATSVAAASPLVTNIAESPSAAIAAYYQAMVKKDEKAFRQALSKATLSEFSAGAQSDGEKTLVGWHNGFSSPPKKPYETRNERISGDTALVEIKDSDTGLWSLTKLVREDGQWKMDLTNATAGSLLKQQPKQ